MVTTYLPAVVEVYDVVVLLTGHRAHHALAFQQADEQVVGVNVELLLLFALHVLGPLRAQDVLGQSGLVHFAVHHFARQSEAREQLAEFARGIGELVLTFGDELGEGLDGGHGDRWTRRSEGRTMTRRRLLCCKDAKTMYRRPVGPSFLCRHGREDPTGRGP
jgi:hypothetical protein